MEVILGVLAYVGVGNLVANRFYFPRRHGVRGRLGAGVDGLDAGMLAAIGVAVTWPIAVLLPAVRNPQLCRHEHHIIAREEARQRFIRVDEALRYENN